ncbi:MAG: pentapeptide repeat-containing protein [Candidatus Melainabacteria bacterium]|nr:pentapeptide repeat-containing protein [Candidatus Melainabacteria bacterium]
MAILISTSGDIAFAKKRNKRGSKKVSQVQLLYVQTATSGSLEETSPGQLLLTLEGILPSTIWFANRPQRLTGSEPTNGFVESSWIASGFKEDPPNAALEAEFEDGSRSVITLEIESPEYDPANNKITYMAILLDGEPTEALTHLHANSNSELSGSFQHSVLFIDDADFQVINGCIIKPFTTCTESDLHGVHLKGFDLTGANLANTNLTGAILQSANLTLANLPGVNLRDADLISAILQSATLTNANLISASLDRASLTGADLTGANLTNALLTGADLRDAFLHSANLTNAYLVGAILERAKLTSVNLTGADLRNADLIDADLTRAILTNTDLTGANLTSANLANVNLTSTILNGAILTNAKLAGATWTDGDTCFTENCQGKAY